MKKIFFLFLFLVAIPFTSSATIVEQTIGSIRGGLVYTPPETQFFRYMDVSMWGDGMESSLTVCTWYRVGSSTDSLPGNLHAVSDAFDVNLSTYSTTTLDFTNYITLTQNVPYIFTCTTPDETWTVPEALRIQDYTGSATGWDESTTYSDRTADTWTATYPYTYKPGITIATTTPDEYLEYDISYYDDTGLHSAVCSVNSVDDNGYDGNYLGTCPISTSTVAVYLDGSAKTSEDGRKLEVYVKEADGEYRYPLEYWSLQTFYASSGTYAFTFTVSDDAAAPWSPSETFLFDACIVDALSSSQLWLDSGNPTNCAKVYVGIATSSDALLANLNDMGILADGTNGTSLGDVSEELDCDNVSILNVKDGVACALRWMFWPSKDSTARAKQTILDFLYIIPIGYATHMVADIVALEATSTTWTLGDTGFGANVSYATTSFDLAITDIGNAAYSDFPGLLDFLDIVVWIIFAFLVLKFTLKRDAPVT